MNQPLRGLLIVLALCSASACETGRNLVSPLVHFDDCSRCAVDGAPTYLVDLENLPETIGGLVPYTRVNGHGTRSTEQSVLALCARFEEMRWPDVVVYWHGGTVNSGAMSTYMGFGMTLTSPIYENLFGAFGLRLAPTMLGLRADANAMVTFVEEPVRACGIQEGDTLMTVAGKSFVRGEKWFNSPHYQVLLRNQPGQEVELIWIRPGAGRMSGRLQLMASDRAALEMLPVAPKMRQYRRSDFDE